MSTYLLVHGAWHGAWCWQRVTPRLQAQGHTVLSPDLPGSGEDKTPIQDVTLKAYADRICAVIDGVPEPVVLVGHSLGGMTITQSAEYRPDKIKVLVYVCAFLLRNGECRFDAPVDPESLMSPDVLHGITPQMQRQMLTVVDPTCRKVMYAPPPAGASPLVIQKF